MRASGIFNTSVILFHASHVTPVKTARRSVFLVFSNPFHARCISRISLLAACAPMRPGACYVDFSHTVLEVDFSRVSSPCISLITFFFVSSHNPCGFTFIGYSTRTILYLYSPSI